MSLKQDLASVVAALRRLSPVVVDVPPAVRFVLLQRYMEMSMRNGRLSLASFGILIFGMAYEAPLVPRIVAWVVLAAVYGVRVWRSRRMLARLDEADPRSDRVYDVLLVLASSVWGIGPFVFAPWVSTLNLYAVTYAAFISIALLGITYIAALPAAFVLVGCSVVPLLLFFALQGSFVLGVLALGTLTCSVALLLRGWSRATARCCRRSKPSAKTPRWCRNCKRIAARSKPRTPRSTARCAPPPVPPTATR